MKAWNPVTAGLKKHATSRDYFLTLKAKASAGRMTATEWDWYRARQKEWEPEVYAADMAAASKRMAIKNARQSLSVDDLEALLAEKRAALTDQSASRTGEGS